MRGEKESQCFRKVEEALFFEDGEPVCSPVDGCSYLNAGKETFAEEYFLYCNPDFGRSCFGLSEADRMEFVSIIRSAKENPSSSEFPDFIFPEGFIEHFQITSSHTTCKGATHAREESCFKKRVRSEIDKLTKEWGEAPSFDKVRTKSWMFRNPVHSHEYLTVSFKQNWERHLRSCEKYSGEKKIGIFLIEYSEIALFMYESVYSDWPDGMSQGDMRVPESLNEYRLSRDKELLEYMYQFRESIKYAIFFNPMRLEVIRVESIPYFIKLMPWEYVIYPMPVTTLSTMTNISVPVDSSQMPVQN